MIEKIHIDEGVRKMKFKNGYLDDAIMLADKINEIIDVIEEGNKNVS